MFGAMRGACFLLPLVVGLAACDGDLSVPMAPPVADAGFDQLRFADGEAVSIVLDGRASCDPMGEALTDVEWTLVSAPGDAPELEEGAALRTGFVAADAGEYLLRLVVGTADERDSEPDFLTVRVDDGEGDDIEVAPPATNACGEELAAS